MTYFFKNSEFGFEERAAHSHHKEVFKSQMAEIIKREREKERERNVSLVQILKLGGIFL